MRKHLFNNFTTKQNRTLDVVRKTWIEEANEKKAGSASHWCVPPGLCCELALGCPKKSFWTSATTLYQFHHEEHAVILSLWNHLGAALTTVNHVFQRNWQIIQSSVDFHWYCFHWLANKCTCVGQKFLHTLPLVTQKQLRANKVVLSKVGTLCLASSGCPS